MFLSNRFLIGMFLLLIASCSSVPNNQSTNKSNDSIKGSRSLDGSQTSGSFNLTDVNSQEDVDTLSIIDPMADIQLNAEIKRAYSIVSKFNKAKKYQQGLNELDRIKLKYPQLSGPDYLKSRLYLSQSQYEKALAAVELSLKHNARNYYSLNLKGFILKEMGDFKKAKEVYLKAIEIYYPYANSHLNLGVLSDLYMGDLDLALNQYKQYLKLNINNKKAIKKISQVKNWVVELERRVSQARRAE